MMKKRKKIPYACTRGGEQGHLCACHIVLCSNGTPWLPCKQFLAAVVGGMVCCCCCVPCPVVGVSSHLVVPLFVIIVVVSN